MSLQRKGTTYTTFGEACFTCFKRTQCLSGSRANNDKRKYLLQILGHRQPDNKFMSDGRAFHKEYFKDVKELNKYGIVTFYKDLYQGKEVEISECMLCSRLHGLSGHIDCLRMRLDLKNREYYIEIVELKPRYSKRYLRQISVYSLVLSDPYCQIWFKKKGKNKYISKNLYLPEPVLNISVNFIYYKSNKEYSFNVARKNEFTKKFILGNKVRIGKLKELHRAGEIRLYNLPYCDSFCPLTSNDKYSCYLKSICQRYPYSKTHQMKFGKRLPIVK